MAPMTEVLARLEQAAEELNTELDSLNETLESLEDRLERAGVGLTFWPDEVPAIAISGWIASDPDPRDPHEVIERYQEAWQLGYAKVGGAWRIAVLKVHTSEDGEVLREVGAPVALASASRNVRVEAAERLEQLFSCLLEGLERSTLGVQKAKRALEIREPSRTSSSKAP